MEPSGSVQACNGTPLNCFNNNNNNGAFFLSMYFRLYPRYIGTAVAQWLRCCATNRKVAGSMKSGVNGIFQNPSDRTMALGSTQK